VSVPISWTELTPQLHSDQFTVENLSLRLDKLKSDPWAEIALVKQSLTKSMINKMQVQ